MSRYQEDLKKIVGIKELENRLDALEAKQPIPGSRAIAYETLSGVQTATGDRNAANVLGANESVLGALDGVTTPRTALPGETAPTRATTDAGAEALADKFMVGGGSDQSLLFGNVAAGILDAVDLFAANTGGEIPLSIAGGINGYSLETIGGNILRNAAPALAGVRGLIDCETGQPQMLLYQDFIHPQDGGADELIPAADWYTGQRWPTGNPSFPFASTIQSSFEQLVQNNWAGTGPDSSNNAYRVFSGPHSVVDTHTGLPPAPGYTGSLQYTYTMIQYMSAGVPLDLPLNPATAFDVNVGSSSCTVGVDLACPIDRPTTTTWPWSSTGGQWLRFAGDGIWSRNPNQVGQYMDPTVVPGAISSTYSTLYACFSDGTRAMKSGNTAAGGFYITEVDPGTLVAEGTALIFRNDATLQAAIPAAEIAPLLVNTTLP